MNCRSSHSIIFSAYDLEKAQILIDLIRILQGVLELIAETRQRARAEGTYPRKIAKAYDTSLNCLKPTHR